MYCLGPQNLPQEKLDDEMEVDNVVEDNETTNQLYPSNDLDNEKTDQLCPLGDPGVLEQV